MATATFIAASARQIDVPAAVWEYRSNAVALRRLAKSAPTRNLRATERAIKRRTDRQREIELSLVLTGNHVLVGELVDEGKLLVRLAADADRPELKARLATTRARIRVLAN